MAEQQHSSRDHQTPLEWKARRSKLAWRALLIFNLAMGAYIFSRPRKKDTGVVNHHRKAKQSVAGESKTEEEVLSQPIGTTRIYDYPLEVEPVAAREPIPDYQQLELFEWMLEEKRKVQPKDREEKKRIDEDKAVLKQYIRGKSIPRL